MLDGPTTPLDIARHHSAECQQRRISELEKQLRTAERERSLLLEIAENLIATSTERVYIAGIGFVTAVEEDQWFIPDGTRGKRSEAFTGTLLDLVRYGEKCAAEDAKKQPEEPTHVD